MKKILWMSLLILILTLTLLCSCGNFGKIAELEKKISDIEYEINSLENELNEWEDIYYDAQTTYNKYKYSSDHDIQKELERTKDIMDEADKEIDEINREIDLLALSKKQYQKQLNRLKEES